MKMKRYIYMAAAMATLALSSCEDMLDTENYTQSNTANYPATFEDAEMLVTSIYANLNHMSAQPQSSFYMATEIACDDSFGGGGGVGDNQAWDHIMVFSDTQFDFCWKLHYKGIFNANTAIEGLLGMQEGVEDVERFNQMLGEAYFMRAYYYYQLAVLFGPVPLITSTTQEVNQPRAEVSVLYGQIASDLKNGIELMSSKRYDAYVEAGHATKWAAEALMARVFLFYTGFYQQENMPLADGGTVTKTEVTAWLEDCINNSGHDLIGDFRNLWAYTNEYTVDDYNYTKGVVGVDGQPLLWAGNGNKEEVFAIKYCNFCGYTFENQEGYSNFYVPYFGLFNADCEDTFPFGMGNGWGTVSSGLWEDWENHEPGDLRRAASIMRIEDEMDMSTWAGGDVTGQWEDCGLRNKKMMPVLANEAYERQGTWANSIFWAADPNFDTANNYGITNWGAHFQDLIIIRFADVLLMHSELTGDATGMNRVRQRAGLPAVGYSLETLQRERRYELCFEGVRWMDIRRWHIASEALSAQNGAEMTNAGRNVVMRDGRYAARYEATDGFFPIPLAQIQLSNGVLVQNKGWDGTDARYTTWDFE